MGVKHSGRQTMADGFLPDSFTAGPIYKDVYYDRNPWFLCTLGAAEQLMMSCDKVEVTGVYHCTFFVLDSAFCMSIKLYAHHGPNARLHH